MADEKKNQYMAILPPSPQNFPYGEMLLLLT